MTATSLDLSAIRTDATSYAATFRTLIGVGDAVESILAAGDLEIGRPIGVGGAPLPISLDRVIATFWGPSVNDGVTGYGFSAISVRCDDDGTDANINGGLMVSHADDYSATSGYGHTVQFYAADGMRGTILGCNTTGGYIRFELGPFWPDSEVGRIVHRGNNAADWIFGWNELRQVTASQSGTTVTASSGTFSSADVGRWVCWNESQTNRVDAEAYRITAFISSTQVTVDTARTVPSQPARICTPRTIIYSNGTMETGPVGIGGPAINSNGRFPMTLYALNNSSINYCTQLLTTDANFSVACGMYQYDALYQNDAGLQGCTQIAALHGSQGIVIQAYNDNADIRFAIGETLPDAEMGRIRRRSANAAEWFFGLNTVRTMTCSQSGTTVTAQSGTFSTADVGRYLLFAGTQFVNAGQGKLFRITAFISSSQVTVDTSFSQSSMPVSVVTPRAEISDSGVVRAAGLNLRSGTVGHVLTCSATDGTLQLQAPASGGSAAWGGITGTLASQTDLNNALNARAPLASPTFTGTVTVSGAGWPLVISRPGLSSFGLGDANGDTFRVVNANSLEDLLRIHGSTRIATLYGPLLLGTYTIASLPSAAANPGAYATVSNSTPANRLVQASGGAWRYVSDPLESAWTVANYTTKTTLDPTVDNFSGLVNFVCSLVARLKTIGAV